jgi:hypothetical protein
VICLSVREDGGDEASLYIRSLDLHIMSLFVQNNIITLFFNTLNLYEYHTLRIPD